MYKINYQSDFELAVQRIYAGSIDMGLATYSWRMQFSTPNGRIYEASYNRDTNEYINAYPTDDGHIKVVFHDHGLGIGQLKARWIAYIDDKHFQQDLLRKAVVPEELDVMLVPNGGDDTDYTIPMPMNLWVEVLALLNGKVDKGEAITALQLSATTTAGATTIKLTISRSSDTQIIELPLPVATTESAGLITALDKAEIDKVAKKQDKLYSGDGTEITQTQRGPAVNVDATVLRLADMEREKTERTKADNELRSAISTKQDKLTAGNGISIEGDSISTTYPIKTITFDDLQDGVQMNITSVDGSTASYVIPTSEVTDNMFPARANAVAQKLAQLRTAIEGQVTELDSRLADTEDKAMQAWDKVQPNSDLKINKLEAETIKCDYVICEDSVEIKGDSLTIDNDSVDINSDFVRIITPTIEVNNSKFTDDTVNINSKKEISIKQQNDTAISSIVASCDAQEEHIEITAQQRPATSANMNINSTVDSSSIEISANNVDVIGKKNVQLAVGAKGETDVVCGSDGDTTTIYANETLMLFGNDISNSAVRYLHSYVSNNEVFYADDAGFTDVTGENEVNVTSSDRTYITSGRELKISAMPIGDETGVITIETNAGNSSSIVLNSPNISLNSPNIKFNNTNPKELLFRDMWNLACNAQCYGVRNQEQYYIGRYNEETGFYECNGITDLTYEEALLIFNYRRPLQADMVRAYSYISYGRMGAKLRTNLFTNTVSPFTSVATTINYIAYYCLDMEVLRLGYPEWSTQTLTLSTSSTAMFTSCKSLKKIIGVIDMGNYTTTTTIFPFGSASDNGANATKAIEEFQFANIQCNMSMVNQPNITCESILFMIENRKGSNAITWQVHADVYNRCADYEVSEEYSNIIDYALIKYKITIGIV